MRVLLTGATGAIGGYIIARMRSAGIDAAGLDLTSCEENGVAEVDLKLRRPVAKLLREFRPHAVVHCASLMDAADRLSAQTMIRGNIDTFINLLDGCARFGVKRVIYCSSRGVYGKGIVAVGPIKESHALEVRPVRSLYGPCKVFSEYLAEWYSTHTPLSLVGMRFSATYGPGKSRATHGPMTVINELFDQCRARQEVAISRDYGPGDFVYYGDIYQAVLRGLTTPMNKSHSIFNIGSGLRQPMSVFVDALTELFPDCTWRQLAEHPSLFAPQSLHLDIDFARRCLGYEPAYGPALALLEMARIADHAEPRSPWSATFPDLETRVRTLH